MKKIFGILGVLLAVSCAGCAGTGPKKLSNEYVTVENYQGVEIEKAEVSEVKEEDIDKVVAHMMAGYTAQHGLPEDTPITDEIVRDTMSDTAETVEEYRNELKKQIRITKEESAREEEELRVWEKVMDHSDVKKYPDDRLKEVKQGLVELYEGYAAEAKMEYEAYLEAIKLTDEDLDEAAKASLKQELVADLIAETFGLKPAESDFQAALEEYAEEYKFANVELLLKAVPEKEMREMVIRDRVKAWLTDRCTYTYAEAEDEEKAEKEEKNGQ